jgi:hypothetical protein
MRPVLRQLLELADQGLPSHRLVGHDKRASHVAGLRLEVHDHVLDGPARGLGHSLHEVLAQPARAGLRMGGDDDLVVVAVAERVHDGRVGIGVHQLARGLDAGLLELREGQLEAVERRVGDRLVVDHVAVLRHVLGADHVHRDRALLGVLLHGLDQRAPRDRFVGDHQELAWLVVHSAPDGGGAPPPPAGAGAPTGAGSFSLNTACTAPGTPYS